MSYVVAIVTLIFSLILMANFKNYDLPYYAGKIIFFVSLLGIVGLQMKGNESPGATILGFGYFIGIIYLTSIVFSRSESDSTN